MQLFSDIDSLMLFFFLMRHNRQAENEKIKKKKQTNNNRLNKNVPTREFLSVGHPYIKITFCHTPINISEKQAVEK